jgi:DnaJ family protein B protein 4
VLTDKKKRQIYDLYGEAGLGNGGGAGAGVDPSAGQYGQYGQQFHEGGGPGMGGFTFHTSNGFEDLFSGRFDGVGGGGKPYGFQETRGSGFGNLFEDMMNQLFNTGEDPPQFDPYKAHSDILKGKSGRGRASTSQQQPQARADQSSVTIQLDCTLEDLYRGRKKNLKVSDKIYLESFSSRLSARPIEKVFSVDIQAGLKDKTKLKFAASHDFPKEVVFEIHELPHRTFERNGNDLKWKCVLKERQVKKGVLIKVPLLDGNELMIDSKDYSIKQGTKVPFKGYGMPILNGNGKRGNLIVQFEIRA